MRIMGCARLQRKLRKESTFTITVLLATEILSEVSRAWFRFVERATSIAYTEYSQVKGQPISNAFNIVIDLVLRGMFK